MITKINNFDSRKYRFLSNFYPCHAMYAAIFYKSVEHAYQAAKTLNHYERQEIANEPMPGRAKRLGQHVALRPDWENIKLDIMRNLVQYKFARDKDLCARLLATDDMELIEGNQWHDTFWGVYEGSGKNHLGRILMEVRAEIRDCIKVAEDI